jgi:hypothetical protein
MTHIYRSINLFGLINKSISAFIMNLFDYKIATLPTVTGVINS